MKGIFHISPIVSRYNAIRDVSALFLFLFLVYKEYEIVSIKIYHCNDTCFIPMSTVY